MHANKHIKQYLTLLRELLILKIKCNLKIKYNILLYACKNGENEKG